MDDLVSWLLAQVAVDIKAAEEMRFNAGTMSDCGEPHDESIVVLRGTWTFDADRLLAECEAKRALIALHHPVNVMIGGDLGGESVRQPGVICWHCVGPANQEHDLSWIDLGEAVHWPCRHLRIYVELYAKLGRPGYQESWRPA